MFSMLFLPPARWRSTRMGPTRRRAHPETVPLPYWSFNEVQLRWHKGRHCVWQVMSSLIRRGAERRPLTAECSSHLMWRCFVSPLVSECFFFLFLLHRHRFLGTNNLHVSGTESHYLISLWWYFWVCDLVGSEGQCWNSFHCCHKDREQFNHRWKQPCSFNCKSTVWWETEYWINS